MNFTRKEWKSLRERNRNCGYVDLFFTKICAILCYMLPSKSK